VNAAHAWWEALDWTMMLLITLPVSIGACALLIARRRLSRGMGWLAVVLIVGLPLGLHRLVGLYDPVPVNPWLTPLVLLVSAGGILLLVGICLLLKRADTAP
jgi:hypothetical protein